MINEIRRILSHAWWIITDEGERRCIEQAPCSEGYHTNYFLIREKGSKMFIAFPEYNFKLTTKEWQLKTREEMAKDGFYLLLS